MKRIDIAKDTVQILEQGKYFNQNGEFVDIKKQLKKCINETQYMMNLK